ncbi:hypothetical protein [Phenylobacterium sp.]|uniref:hypothetical protein n=1 Tax=Phenylobacterium sp. TaxID=1871053 RepID=UPI0035B20C99
MSLTSKTPEQIQSDITAAARSVCLRATSSESFRLEAYGRCKKDTVKAAMAKVYGAGEMAATDSAKLAQR